MKNTKLAIAGFAFLFATGLNAQTEVKSTGTTEKATQETPNKEAQGSSTFVRQEKVRSAEQSSVVKSAAVERKPEVEIKKNESTSVKEKATE